jgi:hypothetical protein
MISAPQFKDESKYLTQEGYGLGVPCWYCRVDFRGYIFYACALTPKEAQSRARQLEDAIDAGKTSTELSELIQTWRPL